MTSVPLRVAEIDVSAIRHNVRSIIARTGGHLITVVKANGYGHGAAVTGQAAIEAGATMLGVADLTEAIELRDASITAPILCWMHGPNTDFDEVIARDITLAIAFLSQLERLADAARRAGTTAEIQLKIDTGLSRNGASAEEWDALFTRAKILEDQGVVRVRGIFTHLSNASAEDDRLQQAEFDRAILNLTNTGINPEFVHIASSAATITSPHLFYNTVRVGLLTYGMSPFEGTTAAEIGLRPVMTLIGHVAAVRNIKTGAGVSYNFTYRTPNDTRLALVPLGYADGVRRGLSGKGASVLIRGRRCPIVGRISMDQCLVNLEPLGEEANEIGLGEPVTMFGDPVFGAPSVDEWAAFVDTINYEIVTGIGKRVVRVPVDRGDA